jgi:hypothetical protein
MKTTSIIDSIGVSLKRCMLALGVSAALVAGSARAATTTSTYDLGTSGSGTVFAVGEMTPWIAQGTLPVGSILREVSIDATLDDSTGGSWASDLNVVVEGVLQIGSDGGSIDWANGQDSNIGATVIDTKTAGVDFPPTIDLNIAGLFLKNTWSDATWSGMVTVTYDIPDAAALLSFGLPDHPAAMNGTDVTLNLPVGTDVTSLAPTFSLPEGATCDHVSGTPYDFSNPVHYIVTSADTLTVKDYTVTVVLVAPSGVFHVNFDTEARTGLVGPAGGAGAIWNEQLGTDGLTASDLQDSTGTAGSVGFTCNTSNVGSWGAPTLGMLAGGAFQWDWSTPSTLEITGLTAGKKYSLYLASFHPNEQGGRGLFSTTNPTTTPGTRIADNIGPNGNSETWVEGVNYVRFDELQPDSANRITITMTGDSGTNEKRAYLSGFQLVETSYTPDPYAEWLAGFDFSAFTDPDLTPTGDPDGDGIINQVEYVNGLNPAIPSGADLGNIGLPGHPAAMNGTDVTWSLPSGTDVTTLAPTFTLSAGASCDRVSGTPYDFSSPVHYIVTSADTLTIKDYTVTVVLVAPSGVFHVNFDTEARTGLVGPAGGAGAIWNEQLGTDGLTASGLLDSTGAASSVGFTCNASNIDPWGAPTLGMLTGAAFNFARTPFSLVISGLTPGKKYALYLASFHPNEQGSRSLFSTSNQTTTPGTRIADSFGPNGNSYTWVEGVNFVRFDNIEPDSAGRITVAMASDSGTSEKRAYLNGFQLMEAPATPPDPYAAWLATFDFSPFTNPDLTPTGDPDGDGITNQVEYAYGLDPTVIENFAGGLMRERWENLPGSRVTDLTCMRGPLLRNPGERVLVPGVNESGHGDSYGSRYRGFITAPVSGSYRFWIAGHNEAELWIADGTIRKVVDNQPVVLTNRYGKQRIALIVDPRSGQNQTEAQEFDKFASQQSRPVELIAGQSFYFEVLHKQDGGDDNVSVAWQVPGSTRQIIPAAAFTGDDTQDDDLEDDNLPDAWEAAFGLNPADNGLSDPREGQYGDWDGDGLTNLEEYQLGTNPASDDTDGDGLSDKAERDYYHTNPLGPDTGATYATLPPHNFSSATGRWNRDASGTLTALERRGEISYTFTIAAGDAGVYQISLVGGAAGAPRPIEKLPLVFSINGNTIGSATLTSLHGASDTASVLTPWLKPGAYTVTILHDNYRAALQLRIDSLLILGLAGVDANGNHRPDWLDQRLAADNRLVRVPATSLTSPVCIEGIADPGADRDGVNRRIPGLTLKVNNNPLAPKPSVDSSFYANVPLSESAPVTLKATFQSGALTESREITWLPTNLRAYHTLHIRKGDALRLDAWNNAGVPGNNTSFTVTMDGTLLADAQANTTHTSGQPFTVTFDTAGKHTLIVNYGNKPPRTVTLHVHHANFGPALSVRAHVPRDWTPPAIGKILTVQPDSRLSWIETTADGAPRSFRVTPSEAGQRQVLARLPDDVDGAPCAIVACGTVNAFYLAYLDETSDARILAQLQDGTWLMQGSMVAVGLPNDIRIRLTSYFQGTVFPNGDNILWLDASNFDANGICTVYFEWNGSGKPKMCNFIELFMVEPTE